MFDDLSKLGTLPLARHSLPLICTDTAHEPHHLLSLCSLSSVEYLLICDFKNTSKTEIHNFDI